MTDVLLKELSNSDIDWISAAGQRNEVSAGTVLSQPDNPMHDFHILLEGSLSVTLSQPDNNPLSLAYAALEGNTSSDWEIDRLCSGEIAGDIPFLHTPATTTTVKAVERSLVMSIPQQQLAAKLQQDFEFAARFYRAITILLFERMRRLVRQVGRSSQVQGQPIRDALFVFSELNDSDIDWMMATGAKEQIAANTLLIRERGPVDALYILLSGSMALSIAEDDRNPLARAFAALEERESLGREIAKLSRGEIIGETAFIDGSLPMTTVRTLEDSSVLIIPRQQLATKLQHDTGFASRFYRVIATLIANRVQGMLRQAGYGRRTYSRGQSLRESVKYEDELDINVLDQMALAGAKFDWILKQTRNSLI
jgi:bacteriocin-type transport-associated protein